MAINLNFTIPDSGIYVNGVATFTSSMSVNNTLTSTGNVVVSNSTQFSNIGFGTAQFGNSTVYTSANQSTIVAANTVAATSINTSGLSTGNSTVTFTANSTQLKIGSGTQYSTVSAASANIGGSLNVVGTSQFNNDVTITGNMIITGSTTTINTINLNVEDNIITLISNATISTPPVLNAGFEVNRGSGSNVSFVWDETGKYFSTGTSNLNVGGITSLVGNATFSGDITVGGNTTLGSAATDGVTIKANTVTVQSNASFNSGLLYLDTLNSRVGIGTNVPAYKVDITGDARATGNVIANYVLATVNVNAASHSVGALFTANATLVNTAAINVTGQVNTATVYATASANIASVVQANTSGLYTTANVSASGQFIGPATGLTGTASSLTSGNSINLNGLAATAYVSNSALTGYNYINATTSATTFVSNSALTGYNYINATTTATTFVSNSALTGYGYVNNSVGTAFNSSNLAGFGVTTFVSNASLLGTAYTFTGIRTHNANVSIGGGATAQLLIGGTAVVANSTGITGTLLTISQPNITANNTTNFNGLAATAYVSNSALTGYGYVNNSVGTAYNSSNLLTFTWNGPGAIGSVTANTGAFTTLTASANVTFDSGTLFVDATNNRVGVGTTTPGAKLDIVGDMRSSSGVILGVAPTAHYLYDAGGNQFAIRAGNATVQAYYAFYGSNGGFAAINGGLTGSTLTSTTNTATIGTVGYFAANGNVGIGNSTPVHKLSISGNVYASANVFFGTNIFLDTNATYLRGTLSDGASTTRLAGVSSANVVFIGAIDQTAANSIATVRVNAPLASSLSLFSNGSQQAIFAANGNIGLNNGSPAYPLDIIGDTRITGTVNATSYNVGATVVANTLGTYATHLNGQLASYYTDIPSRLGYTPVQQGGGTGQGANKVYIGWLGASNPYLGLQIDVTAYGSSWPITAANSTNLNGQAASYYRDASNLNAGTVPTIRLGSGSASSTTYLRGDSTWATIPVPDLASPGPIGATTANSASFSSVGVGTAASGTAGEIRATNEITAYYSSDRRLKENIVPIESALDKLKQLSGVMFDWTDEYIKARGGEDGYFVRKHDTGIIAQDVQQVLPEVVAEREDGTLAVKYEKMMGLVIQAINELAIQVDEIKQKVS